MTEEQNVNEEQFQLDPDKRDWEYDGYGVKRRKDNFQQVADLEMCPKCNMVIRPECRCEKP